MSKAVPALHSESPGVTTAGRQPPTADLSVSPDRQLVVVADRPTGESVVTSLHMHGVGHRDPFALY